MRAFAAELEEVVDKGLLAIAHHLARYSQLLAEPGQEHSDMAIIGPVLVIDLIPDRTPSRSSREPTNIATTR